MIANKTVCEIKQSLTFLLPQLIEAVLIKFVAIVFIILSYNTVQYVYHTIFIKFIISPHSINEVSAILFKNLLLSQIHVLGFQL